MEFDNPNLLNIKALKSSDPTSVYILKRTEKQDLEDKFAHPC